MAGRDSTPEDAVQQSKTSTKKDKPLLSSQELAQQLAQLDHHLHQLLCGYQFYQQAIEALVAQDEPDFNDDWQYGLMLVGEWLQQQGPPLLEQIHQLHYAARGD